MDEKTIYDVKITNLEKETDKLDARVTQNEGKIVEIRIELNDKTKHLPLIQQIVFGLVGLALLMVWNNFFIK